MGFDFAERKTSLYADLFKLQETSNNTMTRSPSSNYSDSSSSGSDDVDGDFAAELCRQMAECMLHEDEEEDHRISVFDSVAVESLKYANQTPCIKLKNQSPAGNQVRVSRGRDRVFVKGAELTQPTQTHKSEHNYVRGRRSGRENSGSGMRAVFLGGHGSRNGSSGTGVFLPRLTNDPVQPKKKSGLSTVLIPTRVLQALELHFKTHSDCAAPPVTTARSPQNASPRDEWKGQGNTHTKFEMEVSKSNNVDELQILPQEWTY